MGAGGSSGAVVPLGSQVTLPRAGVALRAPIDGRVNGYAFSARVSGVAFTPSAGSGANRVAAPGGAELCVFSLSLQVLQPDFLNGAAELTENPAVTVTVGSKTHLPVQLGALGSAVTAVAVPMSAKVTLSIGFYGYSQHFDLRTERRLAPDPPALYRSQGLYPYLSDLPTVTGTLTQSAPAAALAGTTNHVGISVAYLSYFPPDPDLVLPPVGDGDLIIEPSGTQAITDNVYPTAGLPAKAVTLKMPDGRTIRSHVVGQSTSSYDDTSDLFANGLYYFQVLPTSPPAPWSSTPPTR